MQIPSSADQSLQPSLWYAPIIDEPRPLLVALHTWSGNYLQGGGEVRYAQWCQAQDWAFIHPNFRGPNSTPEGCGSDLMVADILDAVSYARNHAFIDEDRIYLIGVSGGGHGSLLLAARAPEIWAGVSAWCGISDLAAWHHDCSEAGREKYVRHMEGACGGPPGTIANDPQYRYRSSVTWLDQARGKVHLDINHGIHDGVTGSVPFPHSLRAFNQVAKPDDRVAEADIQTLLKSRRKPASQWLTSDPLYHEEPLRFRKTSGRSRVTLFEGGHEIIHHAALNWLAQQRRSQDVVWDLEPAKVQNSVLQPGAVESGK